MVKHGGKRKKAGRPKGRKSAKSLEAEKAREVFIKTITKKWKPLIDAALDAGLGHYIEKKIQLPNGKSLVKIYKKSPDQKTLQNLFDQVIGRPKEIKDVNINFKQIEAIQKAVEKILTK